MNTRTTCICLAIAAALAACAPTPTPPTPTPTPEPPLATCKPGETRYIIRDQHGLGIPSTHSASEIVVGLPELGADAVCLSDARSTRANDAGIELEPDPVLRLIEPLPGTPMAGRLDTVTAAEPLEGQQWGMMKIRARDAQGLATGQGTTVAVLDSGVDCRHPDLYDACSLGRDYVGGSGRHPHGTHVAGIAAAVVNTVGILGVAPAASIVDYRVLDAGGSGYSSVIARAVLDAGTGPGVVVNLSLGSPYADQLLDDAIRVVTARGVVVVAAAGNESTDRPSYPGCSPGAIGVAATTQGDGRASFSNYGTCIDIAAPGADILSTTPGGTYETWSGTSMAAPFTSGAVALLLSAGVPPSSVLTVLHQTGDPAPAEINGRRINAWRAVTSAGGAPGPTITPRPPVTAAPTDSPYPGMPTPTPGASPTPTSTRPFIPTSTRTATAPSSPTSSSTRTPTNTPSPPATSTSTRTPTATQTARPIPALTATPRPTECTAEVYIRDRLGAHFARGYIVCPTPTRGR